MHWSKHGIRSGVPPSHNGLHAQQVADLERAADAAVALESRAETAEGERAAALEQARPPITKRCCGAFVITCASSTEGNAARPAVPYAAKQPANIRVCASFVSVLEQMRAMTPRPPLPPGMHLPALLGPVGTAKFVAAVTRHR